MKQIKKHSFSGILTLIISFVVLNTFTVLGVPSVLNVRISQQTNVNAKVDIYYDLIDTKNRACTVYIAFDSNNDGQFDYYPTNSLIGAFGNGVITGANKHIEWNIKRDFPSYLTGRISIANIKVNASEWILNGLSIDEIALPKYSSPFLLDFDFTLRDALGNAIIANPHAFSLICKEDNDPISASETANFMERSKKLLKCFLVLDYTRSMDNANAIGAMERAAKLFLESLESRNNTNALNPESQVGIYEFHAEDKTPQKVSGLSNSKKYLINKINMIWKNYVHQYSAGSRCWDAVGMAINEFPNQLSYTEYRYVIFLSDGEDESSISYDPDTIIAYARSRGIQCFCIGFGDVTGEALANLNKIAYDTGGHYYPAENTNQIEEQFKKIISDIQARYTLRWETIKNSSADTFNPSFVLSAQGQTNQVGEIFKQYNPEIYKGNRRQGKLNFIVSRDLEEPSSVSVALRSQYSPRHIHQLQLNIKTKYQVSSEDWDLNRLEAGGFCPNDWRKEMNTEADGSKTFIVKSPKPDDDDSSEFVFGGFGTVLVVKFRDITSINQLINDLKTASINNNIYKDIGGMTFVIDKNINYSPIYKLDVASIYPSKNLKISISPEDKNLKDEDQTPFFLLYDSGINVTLHTPATTNFSYSINYPPVVTVTSTNTFNHWDINGINNSVNPTLQVKMTDDISITAIYSSSIYQLNVKSVNPVSGLSVKTSIKDINGYTNGITPFARLFNANANVRLSCPMSLDNKLFNYWLIDGKISSITTNLECKLNQNHTVQAVYYSLFNLTVNSQNPDTGVYIQVSTQDISNKFDGTTQFTRMYISNTVIKLTAPVSAGSNKFDHWQVNDINYGQNTEIQICIKKIMKATAVYVNQDAVPDIALYENSHFIPSNTNFYVSKTANGSTVDKILTITNAGTATLSLTGNEPVILKNYFQNYFHIIEQPEPYISPGKAVCFRLQFAPNKNFNGTETCELVIQNSTTNIGTYKIYLSGDFYQKIDSPTAISASDGMYSNKVVITWSKVLYATTYNIYREKTNNAHAATLLGISTKNNYSDTTVTSGVKYFYWIKAVANVSSSKFSKSDSGFAFMQKGKPDVKGKWKYKSKNGKAKLSVKGLGIRNPLANYFEDGCLIGLKDASNYETVDGPRKLEPKKKKNGDIKFWFYNEKKIAVIKYKPNDNKPDKDKLIYKVWKELPAEIIFFVLPPMEIGENSNAPTNYVEPIPVYELYLSPGAEIKNGWRELITE